MQTTDNILRFSIYDDRKSSLMRETLNLSECEINIAQYKQSINCIRPPVNQAQDTSNRINMNICHLTPHYLPSFAGLTTVYREIAAEEIKLGHTVSVVCYFPWKPWKETDVKREQIEGVSVIRLKNHIMSSRYPRLGRFFMRFVFPFVFCSAMKDLACDVLHVAGITHLTYAALIYGKLKKIPVVISLFGEELRLLEERKNGLSAVKQFLRKQLNRYIYRRADAVTCSSMSLVEGLRKLNLRSDSKLIYNGVNVGKFAMPSADTVIARKKQYGLPLDKLILGSVGGISHRKGYDILLDVFARLNNSQPRYHLAIVGGGDVESLERQATKLGIRDAVTFLGAVTYENLLELYPLMDIYVQLPRFEEGVSQTALEAAMFEKPVVLSDCGAMRDSVNNGISGYLIPIDDRDIIAKCIGQLASDKNLIKKMGQAGRKWVAEHRCYATIARQYIDVFSNCLNRSS